MTVENLKIMMEQWKVIAADESKDTFVRQRAAENAKIAEERIDHKLKTEKKYAQVKEEVKPKAKK